MATRKMSKRKAISILGAGTAAGVAWGSTDATAISCGMPAEVAVWSVPKSTLGTRTVQGKVMQSLSCCGETRRVILKGAAATDQPGRDHIRPIKDELDKLGESA